MRLPSIVALAVIVAGCGSKPANTSAPLGPPAFAGLPTAPLTAQAAQRLLMQGTFGATLDGISSTTGQTYGQWFAAQANAPVSLLTPTATQADSDFYVPWWTQVVNGQDQLRQRMAFSLSQILVNSNASAAENGQTIAVYADIMANGALGNFRDLLEQVSLSMAMGQYLTYFHSDKPNPATGSHADENYAREVMQLFSVGLVMLNQDGTTMNDSSGNPVPTYGLPEIENLARVFTGWASTPIPPHAVADDTGWQNADVDNLHPMVCYPLHHDTDAKTIITGVTIPAGGTCQSDMDMALDTLFKHPNVGPFIGKQLIQRLVTSNPSPGYVSRVAAAFNDNGSGTRGDLFAVAEAILTDSEAVTPGTASRLREPVLRFTELYRAFGATDGAMDGKITEYQVVTYQGFLNFGQNAYSSPTVFNFFRPDYQRPAFLAAGLVAPEFQITNEYTSVVLTNQIEQSTYQYIDSSGAPFSEPDNHVIPTTAQSMMLQTKQWEGFASTPGTLVDNLNAVFMAGQMPDAMKTVITTYLATFPASTPPAQLVAEAAFLVVGSPQFAVQR
jgi:uncharacterized protein (DUF1800 family)